MALTATQEKVLKAVLNSRHRRKMIAGRGMAPYLSSARSLVKLGHLIEVKTAVFVATDKALEEKMLLPLNGTATHPQPDPDNQGDGIKGGINEVD